jgi:signal transduction histidine kinase
MRGAQFLALLGVPRVLPGEYGIPPRRGDDWAWRSSYRAAMDGYRGGRWPVASSAALVVLQEVGSRFAEHGQRGGGSARSIDLWASLLLAAGPLLLVFRRRWPGGACAGAAAVCAVYLVAGYPYGPVFASVVVGFVVAVMRGERWVAWGSLAGLYLAHLGARAHDGQVTWPTEVGMLAWALLLVAGAEVARGRRDWAVQQRAVREERERARADEQRLAMARELHDVLAHSISLIHVQAGVALELIDSRPEQARTALVTIKQASKEALGEVRQVLGTLRTPGAEAPRTPTPGLDRLAELVRQAGAAGLTVRLRQEGAQRGLPQGVELAAFRIVQEALTNIIRHSAAREAELLLRYRPDGLELLVSDDGPPSAGGGPVAGGSGSGLAGMRERAAALGGTLEAGPLPGGGFRVQAVLPTAAAPAPGKAGNR